MISLDFDTNFTLENERARLEPLKESHFQHLLHFSENEPELWKYALTPAAGAAQLKNYIHLALESRKDKDSYPFVVFDKATNAYAGSTRFYDFKNIHQSVQMGYTWYGKDFQGTGLNSHCKLLLLAYAFETLELERVEFRADANNARSIRAMKSFGCKEEGILRSNCASPTGRRDSIVLSILKNEWTSGIKDKLVTKLK